MARSGFESTIDVRPDDVFATPPPGASISGLPVVDRGSYHVVGEFAKGGIGRILRARDPSLDRTVALKELIEGGGEAEERFLREALVTARLQHPSIVPIYEAGRWPTGEPFYTMKLVSGRPLIEAIERAPTLAERLALVPHILAVAEAMAYAHGERIIHRDLKPQNILLGEFGETIIIDWGLAKSLAPEACDEGFGAQGAEGDPKPQMSNEKPTGQDESIEPSNEGAALTVVGAILGTPLYMAPEQAHGLSVDERADVYAMGAILYHVLAGAPAYEGRNVAEILTKVMTELPPPLEKRTQGIPTDLLAIVQKAMCPEIEGRYRTAKELAEDLRRFQTGQIVAAHRYSAIDRFRRFVKRHRAPLAVAFMALVFIAIGAAFSVLRILDAQHRAEQKQLEAETSERRAISRADELTIAQARASLDHDPTKSIALLKSLSPAWTNWGAVRTIAADAEARGIARIFREHSAGVYDVAFSPDGNHLASVGIDKRVVLRDLRKGTTRVLLGHPDVVRRVAFSPDGTLLATGGQDMKIRLWDLSNGQVRVLSGHEAAISAIKFSPDGKYLASRGSREKVWLWNVATGEGRVLSRTNELRKDGRGCIAFSPDGAILTFADEGGLVLINLTNGERTLWAGIAPGGVEMAFSSDGTRIVTGGEDGAIQLWNVSTGIAENLYVHSSTRAPIVAFAGGDKYIVSPGTTGAVNLWDIAAAKLRRLGDHAGYIGKMAVTHDGSAVVTAGDDSTVRYWNIETGHAYMFRGFSASAVSVTISPDGARIAGASADTTVRLWNAPRRSFIAAYGAAQWIIASPKGHSIAILGNSGSLWKTTWTSPKIDFERGFVAKTIEWQGPPNNAAPLPPGMAYPPPFEFSADERQIAIAYAGGMIRVFTEERDEPSILDGSPDDAFDIAFAPDGQRLVAGGHNGIVRIWDLATRSANVVARHGVDIRAITYSPDGKSIASGAMDGTLWITDAITGKSNAFRGHGGPISHLAYSPDGATLLSASLDRTIRLWNPASGSSITVEVVEDAAKMIRVFPDGGAFASIHGENEVRLWDMRTGKSRGVLRGNTPEFVDMAISPDGQRVTTGVQDGSTWLWDLATGDGRPVDVHEGNGPVVAFAPDGRSIVTANFDGTIAAWADDLPTDATALRAWLEEATSEAIQSQPEQADISIAVPSGPSARPMGR